MRIGISKCWMWMQRRFYHPDILPPVVNLSNRSFLLWGVNTDIGKTLVASLLAMDNHNNEVFLFLISIFHYFKFRLVSGIHFSISNISNIFNFNSNLKINIDI